jgi:hypothetical protein
VVSIIREAPSEFVRIDACELVIAVDDPLDRPTSELVGDDRGGDARDVVDLALSVDGEEDDYVAARLVDPVSEGGASARPSR